MISALLALSLLHADARSHPVTTAVPMIDIADSMTIRGDIADVMMKKFHTMAAADKGIFHDDVTAAVAPYFPVGQPIAETRRIAQEQKLGPLKPFKGSMNPGADMMFVTKLDLMSEMFSNVYVVFDFDFAGTNDADMVLKGMRAYLKAGNM
jgi:hypothetical protein